MQELNQQLETRTDYESEEYMAIIEEVSTLGEKFYAIEEINYDKAVELTLLGLGFKREDFNKQTSEFSGGYLPSYFYRNPTFCFLTSLRTTWTLSLYNGWKTF